MKLLLRRFGLWLVRATGGPAYNVGGPKFPTRETATSEEKTPAETPRSKTQP